MYSIGVRQKILDDNKIYRDNGHSKPFLNEDWGKKYGQVDDLGNAVVKLFRWVSGSGKTVLPSEYKSITSPAMYTELCKDETLEEDEDKGINKNKYLNPGTGEFLYPTDIVITKIHLLKMNS